MNSWPFPDDPEDGQFLVEALKDHKQVGGALPRRGRIEFRRKPVVGRRSQ